MVRKARVTSGFERLPAEIITYTLGFLPADSLANLSQVCRLTYTHCSNELLWARFVQDNVPIRLDSPYPCKSWRELYIAHHPYWFLARYKIWFADKAPGGNTMTGNMIIARYDPRRGCIEAYRLLAEHGDHTFESWSWNPDVIIHTFNPRVHVWLDDPMIKLDLSRPKTKNLQEETFMQTGSVRGVSSALSLCQAIPEALQHRSMALWPPKILPAKQRVRCESSTNFHDIRHRPKTFAEASDQTFRLRKVFDRSFFTPAAGLSPRREDVMTFSTLPEEHYTASRLKPWQGIWVGDYSGHGCEFLLVLQREPDPRVKPIKPVLWRDDNTEFLPGFSASSDEESDSDIEEGPVGEASTQQPINASNTDTCSHSDQREASEDPSCRGRLEAIKLTGDPNVPRGQYTWIAEDLSDKGLLRVAHEQMFQGARVVKSVGHCAARNFKNDRFVASQLIMVSHDTLAQYWEDFGHISFYKRVDLDQFLHF